LTPLEVAHRAFPGQFKVKGSEIIPRYCPFCNGGNSKDRDTFALNVETGLYNCKRSTCGAQGTLSQLCEKLGVPFREKVYEPRRKKEKTHIKPKVIPQPITTSKISSYLAKRKFSQQTLSLLKVSEIDGKITFPYYENKELVMVKYRHETPDGKWKSFSMEPGGKLVFWGMDLCSPDMPLVITEGEMDTLSVWECGIQGVSLPNGCKSLDCVDLCWDWLKQFKTYYIWTDNDEGGIEARNNLIKRLGPSKCLIVAHPRYKDANEVLYFEGKDGVIKCISDAEAIPLIGLKSLAELPEYDPTKDILVPTGIYEVDDSIEGGLRMGEVSIWTGFNSSGKSTLLGQVMLNAIDQGFNICVYSGELPDRIFRYWVDLQAAGPEYIKQETNKRNKLINKPDFKIIPHIRNWYSDKFWLYSSEEVTTQEAILEVFEYAYRRHDCKIFMADNLMSLALGAHSDSDFYRKQADFIGRCKDFVKKYDTHIHIVAHPRKSQNGEIDVAGSGNITNWADNVFEMKRFTQKELAGMETDPKFKGKDISNSLKVKKNRFLGRQDRVFFLSFNEISKRYYTPGLSPNWNYGWVKAIGKQSTIDELNSWNDIGEEVFIEE
jgi:archaellum biogenesis ATPase FlaH